MANNQGGPIMDIFLHINIDENKAKLISVNVNNHGKPQNGILVDDMQVATDVCTIAFEAINTYLDPIATIERPEIDPHLGETPIPVPKPVKPIYDM